jgi:TRIAP1/MDM35 family protein
MDSIGAHCTPLKRSYEECFNKWFTQDFLKGLPEKDREDPCEEVFNEYKACVMVSQSSSHRHLVSTKADMLG